MEVGVGGNSWEMDLFWYTWDHVVVYVMVCACGLEYYSFQRRVVIVVTGAEDESILPPPPPPPPRACTLKSRLLMSSRGIGVLLPSLLSRTDKRTP